MVIDNNSNQDNVNIICKYQCEILGLSSYCKHHSILRNKKAKVCNKLASSRLASLRERMALTGYRISGIPMDVL